MKAAAIVLAAGASRRMGTDKLLVHLGGEPLIRRAVRLALAAGLAPVVVVLRGEGAAARAALTGLACDFASNPHPDGPTSDSLHLGLQRLPMGVEAAVIMLPDMVEVTAGMLGALPAAAQPNTLVVASRYGDVVAPPALLRRALFPEVLAWHGEGCIRAMVRRHPAEAVLVDWPDAALEDVDTPADLARALGRRP